MTTWIVVFSTKNNRPYENPCWRHYGDYSGLDAAKDAYSFLCDQSDSGYGVYCAGAETAPITQVAIMRDVYGKPRYHHDNRDKSNWPIGIDAAGIVNSVNSDFTVNK